MSTNGTVTITLTLDDAEAVVGALGDLVISKTYSAEQARLQLSQSADTDTCRVLVDKGYRALLDELTNVTRLETMICKAVEAVYAAEGKQDA